MKRILFVLLLCVASVAAFAQKKNKQATMAVAATNMNVLYIAVPNPLDIAVSGFDDENLMVTSEGATVEKLGNGKYTILVGNTGPAIVSVSAKTKRGVVQLGQREFRAKRVPDPTPYLGGLQNYSSGTITKAELCSAIGVTAYLPTDLDFGFKVLSFEVSAIIGGSNTRIYTSGNTFSDAQKSLFKQLKPGDKVYIEDIKCTAIDGSIRYLGALAFKIKELD